jgi:tetratricopeptide (TPR) repeat protein/2-polyprenyl-3-methyl-5-hydroxy-6-metoxy-1,4-benzoquinol methylase
MELTIEQALQRAVEAHNAGKVQDAESLYRAILQAQPNHPDANHNLGVLAVSLNKTEVALPLFKTALEANPNQGQFWLSYVDALIKEKQFDNARNVLEQGKKRGLAGEKVDVLAAQLTTSFLTKNLKLPTKNNPLISTQQRKKVSIKKEKKRNLLRNSTKSNQIKSPPEIELKKLLEHYERGQYDLTQNLAISLTQQYPNHPFGWKVLGALFKQTGKLQDSVAANQKVLEISPNAADAHSNLGITLQELGRLEDAEISYKKAIAIKPDYAEAHSNLGNALQELGRLEDAEISYKKAIAIKPDLAEAHYNLGITLQELGRLEDAETSYKKAIAINPNYAQAHSNLGITLKKLGRLEDAETCYNNAILIKPDYAEAHGNLGNTLQELGRLEDAETSYKKAISINPNYAQAYSNLGITLQELGRLEDAVKSYKKAISINPNYAQAHSNLGITLQELGRLEDAVISYNNAIEIKPDLAEAHYNLGISLQKLSRLENAEASYKKAIAFKPDYSEAHRNLGITLQELGRQEDAFKSIIESIRIKPTVQAKGLFIEISNKINIKNWDLSISQLVITALLEPWGRPSKVMPFAMRLLSNDKEFSLISHQSNHDINEAQLDETLLRSISEKEFEASPLVQAMLTSTPIADAHFEAVFTSLRAHLLKFASTLKPKEDESDDLAALYCSLAKQCFINEYVYFQTTDEIDRSQQLRDLLTKALEEDQRIPSVWVIAIACYFPLYSIAGAEKLLQKNYSNNIYSVLVQQIQEPLKELDLRKSIPSLTSIENKVSLKVQSQYEENPYPRWTHLRKDSSTKYLNSYIQSKFPFAGFHLIDEDRNPEILIAGCGTGQHSIETSQLFKGAKILAVDLSMASLGYAKRKTEELGIESIEYAQADLLKLNSLGRTFDVIESSGVLHHLENPFEGWEVLLSLLRSNGLMRLGLYSELARRDIVRVRNLISSAGIGSSSQEIRDYRRYLLKLNKSENYGFATNSLDFFSTSACRDLLFHVQEHRMDLRRLDRFFKDHELTFLGFQIDSSVIQAYKKRFSNDISATNLEQWHIYEQENPNTFFGMYQFFVQRQSWR